MCILKAFSNSLAADSDDSSRCGVMLELQLDEEQEVIGAGISTYGLEASRVTQPHHDERNFHVFHYLAEGSSGPERTSLQVGDASEYKYLSQNGPFHIPGVDDEAKYHEMKAAMVALDFTAKERASVLRMLSLILQIGNIKFTQPEGQGVPRCVKDAALENAATLLRVEKDALADALCASNNVMQANADRDLLARSIYSRLHRWIVRHLHNTLCANDFLNVMVVLDPPGFEVLDGNNGYEQFMRNFAAEKVCKLIDDLAFTRAQEDLRREEVAIPPTFAYPDNQATLDVFEAPKSGLLDLLERTTGTKELLSAARKAFARHPKISFPEKNAAGRAPEVFTIRHRCGAVEYSPAGFKDLEQDTLSADVVACIGTAQCQFARVDLFRVDVDEVLTGFVEAETYAGHLQHEIAAIQRVLKATELRFVYCLRPNTDMQPGCFDLMSVVREMRSGGLAAYVNFLTQSLCWRLPYQQFNEMFNALHPNRADQDPNVITNCKRILEEVLGDLSEISSDGLQFGKNKVFLRREEYGQLVTRLRTAQDAVALDAQALVRANLWANRFAACKSGSLSLQSWLRGALARHQYKELLAQKAELEARHRERKAEEMELLNEESKKVWAELEAEKSAQRAQEAAEAAQAAMAAIEESLMEKQPFQETSTKNETPVDLIIAARMQDYYDGQLVVVQKELDTMESDEREEYLARKSLGAVDKYQKAIHAALSRRRDLTGDQEKDFMAEEDVLAHQARIVEKAFAGMRRLEQLETIIDLEDEDDANTTKGVDGLDTQVVGIVDKLVADRLAIIDGGGNTPEQVFGREKAQEEAKWQQVESFLAARAKTRDLDDLNESFEASPPRDDSPGGGAAGGEDSDGGEIELEALESQRKLDELFQEMHEVLSPGASPTKHHHANRYKDKYDYKYKYNMFEVAGTGR